MLKHILKKIIRIEKINYKVNDEEIFVNVFKEKIEFEMKICKDKKQKKQIYVNSKKKRIKQFKLNIKMKQERIQGSL